MQFSTCFRPVSWRIRRAFYYLIFGVVSAFLTSGTWALAERAPALQVDKGDCIVLVGNTFAERMWPSPKLCTSLNERI